MGRTQTGSTTTKYCIRYLPQKGEFLIGSRIVESSRDIIHPIKSSLGRVRNSNRLYTKSIPPILRLTHTGCSNCN